MLHIRVKKKIELIQILYIRVEIEELFQELFYNTYL